MAPRLRLLGPRGYQRRLAAAVGAVPQRQSLLRVRSVTLTRPPAVQVGRASCSNLLMLPSFILTRVTQTVPLVTCFWTSLPA
jgi:hypothetical protein